MKKGWKFLILLVIPAFFVSCSSKVHYYSYRYKKPQVKIRVYSGKEKVIVITKKKYKSSDLAYSIDNIKYRGYKKLGIRIKRKRDIQKFIYFYAVKNKKYTQKVLERASLYLPMIKSVFRKYGLPEDLSYLPFIESGFDPYATSVSGAAGLWQFVKGTGRKFGLRINRYVDERRDPYKSTVAAAKYLTYLYNIFGKWDLAIAAYNCGEGCVLNKLKKDDDNFWDIKYRLPQQTREYVPRFIASLIIIKNPEKFGLKVKEKTYIKLKKKIAKRSISLKKLGYIYDIDYELLRMYNAHFKRGIVLKGYNVYIPTESSIPVYRKVSYKRRVYIKHIVKRGETLYRISRFYNVPIETIKKINKISGNSIKVGQVLKIPRREYAYE